MLNVIVEEKLYDQQYIQTYVEGFDAWKESIKAFTPEEMAPICGIDAETLREVARAYARAESAIIFWGMGVSQHTHGTDNARCLIALSLITGQIGRPGTGLHPLVIGEHHGDQPRVARALHVVLAAQRMQARAGLADLPGDGGPVSYTHLTLPTKRIV